MEIQTTHDVLILGAGPAGTATAIRLAGMGLDVGIVERRSFPRKHVGICMSESTLALLDHLGVANDFEDAGFWRRNLTVVRWESAQADLVPQLGHHVDRGALDSLLLAKALAAGVKVYQPAQVEEIARFESAGWRLRVASSTIRGMVSARFLVDAAGRRGAVPGRRIKDGPPLLALHATWALETPPLFDGLIAAGDNAWMWYAQTAPDRAMISVFHDPRFAHGADPHARYLELLHQFHTLELEAWGRPCTSVKACDATSHHAVDPEGRGFIRVGDACITVDPLSSQGVHLALQSGLQAAVVVNTILTRPDDEDLARQFFRMRVAGQVERHAQRTREEYARAALTRSDGFWLGRAAGARSAESDSHSHASAPPPCTPDHAVRLSPDVHFQSAPVIEGDYVTMRGVLHHPAIDGGFAYLQGIEMAGLLRELPPSIPYDRIPLLWADRVAPVTGSMIAAWLWDKRVLIAAT